MDCSTKCDLLYKMQRMQKELHCTGRGSTKYRMTVHRQQNDGYSALLC